MMIFALLNIYTLHCVFLCAGDNEENHILPRKDESVFQEGSIWPPETGPFRGG